MGVRNGRGTVFQFYTRERKKPCDGTFNLHGAGGSANTIIMEKRERRERRDRPQKRLLV
jgi:hypothetical protein